MSHQKIQHITTSKVLEHLDMDLMGPMQVESLGGKKYAYVIVDDFSRYTWISFTREKPETFEVFKDLCQKLQREKDSHVIKIISDHGRNLRTINLLIFVLLKESVMNFLLPLLLSKIGLWNAKTELFKNLSEL